MSLFVSGKIDVLVCTSIIESGIDVPNANCIIINNSHIFGLSQLYQMRGRVGRGVLQAYAYLLVPRGVSLSERAFKRIKTIDENTRLGSGYNISISDMELRGSGSLFGYRQSGGSGSMGYEMYTRLIQRTVHESGDLESGFRVLPEDVEIELSPSRYIPESYISVESVRMSVYKSLVAVFDQAGLDDILYCLDNRFGGPPASVINLINESRLRLLAARAGINSVVRRGCGILCSVGGRGNESCVLSFVNYAEHFLNKKKIIFHFLPLSKKDFSLCVHFTKKQDSYSILSRFFNKFNALEKNN
jgi:transcription-repair coupling factor (superfamily II helicase)